MRKMKYVIGFLIFFIVIGYAAISISLSITGNATILSDLDDFKVYFSDVTINDTQDYSIVNNEKELVFNIDLNNIGSTYKITYDVTNASSFFDASIVMNCTQGDDLLSITNEFDTSTNLEAKSTRTGSLTLKRLKPNRNENDSTYSITCSINANAVDRQTNGTGEEPMPIQPINISIGELILIEGEQFNVISQTDTTVTLLARYNIGNDYKQSKEENGVKFADSNGWEYNSSPLDIDIQQYDGPVKTYVNNYVSYIKQLIGHHEVSGDIMTLSQFPSLGCTISQDYSYIEEKSCINSPYFNWLVTGQEWWIRSVFNSSSNEVWMFKSHGGYKGYKYTDYYGVRPTITIPKQIAKYYYKKTYETGVKLSINSENFNVISDNGNTVTLFAQYNLDTNYRQSTTKNGVTFSNVRGWAYSPGPKDIDIQQYDGDAKTYINNYVTYLIEQTKDSNLTGNLISLTELKNLGCTIKDDYSYDSNLTCVNSQYASWVVSVQDYWTRSAHSGRSGDVWTVWAGGSLFYNEYDCDDGGSFSIRPIITISKSVL